MPDTSSVKRFLIRVIYRVHVRSGFAGDSAVLECCEHVLAANFNQAFDMVCAVDAGRWAAMGCIAGEYECVRTIALDEVA